MNFGKYFFITDALLGLLIPIGGLLLNRKLQI